MAQISSRSREALPDVETLRQLLQSLAMLDAVMSPEWEYRYFSFNASWAEGEQMGSMRNGQGDDVFVHFGAAGVWIKGFDHECVMSPFGREFQRVWPGVLDAVPTEFAACVEEPAFETNASTFCLWRRHGDAVWSIGPVEFPPDAEDPDGSAHLLFAFDGRPATYREFATEYYERDVDLGALEHVYAHRPLTPEVVTSLNPDVSIESLAGDIAEIGYPRL